jgi:transposase
MAGREVAVKKYVVRLSAEERERLEALRSKGTIPARRLLKVQILLKADVSDAGEGWSDGQIMKAFDTTDTMVYTVRKKLVEEGLDAALSRKPRKTPPVARIFDGEREAQLIALACSDPPPGFARWTLRLLEEKVVERQIVCRASDSTIGRVLKKHPQAPYQKVLGDSARGERRFRRRDGGCAGGVPAPARSQAPADLS